MNLRRLAGLTLASAVAVVGFAAPMAQAAPEQCTSRWGCLWEHEGPNGSALQLSGDDEDLGDWKDRADSVWNRTNFYLVLFSETGFRGQCRAINKQTPIGDLGAAGFHDKTRSVRFYQYRPAACLLLS